MTPKATPTPPILCDGVLGNVSSLPAARFVGKSADLLSLTWLECTRRASRQKTAGGRQVAVLLPIGSTLSHGDVLYEDEGCYIVVEVRPCELWVVTTLDRAGLARVAVELGNLHVPVEVTSSGELLTPPDGPTKGVLRRHGVAYSHCERRFAPLRVTVKSGVSVARSLLVVRR
jgi:urease accessory protein UreE